MKTPKDKIKIVIHRLGISGSIAAKAMRMSNSNYNKKAMPSAPLNNSFTEQNYNDLVNFLIDEVTFIKYHVDSDNTIIEFQSIENKVNELYDNFNEYRKVDGWNLFNELKIIVNSMETIQTFSNNDLYTKIINSIVDKSNEINDENHQFSIAKYNDYALLDCKGKHSRWFNFMHIRRNDIVSKIFIKN